MATTISNGESGSSVRAKLNDIWDGLELNEIAASIADTAVDVFVYDTSKDSDGGAWRKRTQATSWYNETLNTATRGSRKEFPAVAVIVAESNQVTIYDGDDPDLPMWMVFNSASNYFLNQPTVSAVTMLNGKLAVTDTASNNTSLAIGDFVSEFCQIIRSNYDGDATGLVNRNQSFWSSDKGNTRIVSNVVNDVAMTVLPNAPIDPATGLPVPTIAVATDGGVSVITDSGAVYDSASTLGFQDVAFDVENTLFYMRNASVYSLGMALDGDYTAGDGFGDLIASSSVGGIDFQLLGARQQVTTAFQNGIVATGGYDSGDLVLGVHKINKSSPSDVLSAGITSTYNTGWMNGDIKGAFLSDTDDTDLVGAELVTNGDFATNSDWSLPTGFSISGGELLVSGATAYIKATQNISTEVGKTYVYTLDVTSTTTLAGLWRMYVQSVSGGTNTTITYTQLEGVGTYTATFTATTTTTDVSVYCYSGTNNGSFDNASVRLAEEDRSVNGNGLQVFGTVTRTPVATGADLVAYSGFSASNYLEQPYNSDLDFGTGDFCVMGWVKADGASVDYVFSSYPNDGSSGGFFLAKLGDNTLTLSSRESGVSSTTTTTSTIQNGVWAHVCAVRSNSGTTQSIYINGVLSVSNSVTARNITNSGNLLVGIRGDALASAWFGYLALLRISATAPSPEQIAKIYNDEKVLFQEGAQATLAGTSDAVTSLAYDDVTQELLVGTSQNTSVFRGLRRVETISGSASAISASNGLRVIED